MADVTEIVITARADVDPATRNVKELGKAADETEKKGRKMKGAFAGGFFGGAVGSIVGDAARSGFSPVLDLFGNIVLAALLPVLQSLAGFLEKLLDSPLVKWVGETLGKGLEQATRFISGEGLPDFGDLNPATGALGGTVVGAMLTRTGLGALIGGLVGGAAGTGGLYASTLDDQSRFVYDWLRPITPWAAPDPNQGKDPDATYSNPQVARAQTGPMPGG